MSEITEIPKCNCDSHNNSVCDVCQIYIPEIERLNEEVKELKKSWYEMHSSFEAERTVSDRYRMALEEIVARGTDYDSTMNELVYIAKAALKEVQGE